MRIHIFISLNMCSFTLICKWFQAAGETFSSYQQDEIKLILKRARYEGLYVPNRKRNLKDLTTTAPWEILVSSRVVQSNIKTSKETEKSVPGTLQTGVYDKNAFDASVFLTCKNELQLVPHDCTLVHFWKTPSQGSVGRDGTRTGWGRDKDNLRMRWGRGRDEDEWSSNFWGRGQDEDELF